MKTIKRLCALAPDRTKHTQYSREEIDILANACGVDIRLGDGYKKKADIFAEIVAKIGQTQTPSKRIIKSSTVSPSATTAARVAVPPSAATAARATVPPSAATAARATVPPSATTAAASSVPASVAASAAAAAAVREWEAVPASASTSVGCSVRPTCPRGYRRAELVKIATDCGIDIKRGPSQRGTLKNMTELCQEIFEVMNKEGIPPKVKSVTQAEPRFASELPLVKIGVLRKSVGQARSKEYQYQTLQYDKLTDLYEEITNLDKMIREQSKIPSDMFETLNALIEGFDKTFLEIKNAISVLDVHRKQVADLRVVQNTLNDKIRVLINQEDNEYGEKSTPEYHSLRNLQNNVNGVILDDESNIEEIERAFLIFENTLNKIRKIIKSPERAQILHNLVPIRHSLYNKRDRIFAKIQSILKTEGKRFGDSPIYQQIEAIYQSLPNRFDDKFNELTQESLDENQRLIDTAQEKINQIEEEIKRLGRRCVNRIAPITLEEVDEIPEEDWIYLSNGTCWDIDTLISFIKETANGQNTTEKVRRYMEGYPSDKIWENSADYEKITGHPKAKQAQLHQFIKSRMLACTAKQISDETTRLIYESGSKLWSRGPPFDEAVRAEMNQKQLEVWNRAKEGMSVWEMPASIKNYTNAVEKEIFNIINGVIKSEAISVIWNHYKQLSKSEKDALEKIYPRIGVLLRQCYGELEQGEEQYCVMQMGDKLIQLYNKIAPYKEGFEPLVNVPGLLQGFGRVDGDDGDGGDGDGGDGDDDQ